MHLMGMEAEADRTKAYVLDHLSFDHDVSVSTVDMTTRILGSLLAVYQMTGDPKVLTKAEDLGRRLLPAFDSPTGMPYRAVNLKTRGIQDAVVGTADVGTLLLEFGTLSHVTKNPAFYEKAKTAIVELYHRRSKATGLVGQRIDVDQGTWSGAPLSHIGRGIDGYYEYLLKCATLFGDRDCADMWRESLTAINRYLADDRQNGLWYGTADMNTGRLTESVYDSLQGYFPALLAMAGDLPRARRLQDSAFTFWTINHLTPDVADYSTMQILNPPYYLRPEMVESTYYLSHYTKDPKYLQMGRTMFSDVVTYCRTDEGYTVVNNVVTKEKGNRMPSALFSETFKYFYLLFSPRALDFETVVFNTRGHPLRRTSTPPRSRASS